MLTYQDFEKAADKVAFIEKAIAEHRQSAEYLQAVNAELYDQQKNVTINSVVRTIYTAAGIPLNDPTSSNNKIASNYFHRLNNQRVSYLLGNGVSFTKHVKTVEVEGKPIKVDETKDVLGPDFDTQIFNTVYSGETCGQSFMYIEYDSARGYNYHLFPLTEFVPLLDETDGRLRVGIRFWSLDWENKPVTAVLYESDGVTRYRTKNGSKGLNLEEVEPKHGYNKVVVRTRATGPEDIGYENLFSDIPIVPYYGRNKTSTLVGMQAAIDSYDLIQSGFANDLQDCAQIYWLVGGSLGMDDTALKKFRERLIFQHIGVADLDNSTVTPYTNEIPHEARVSYLNHIRNSIYEGFGALDVTAINSGNRTATEIQAAYEALEQEADALESRVTPLIRQALRVIRIDDIPTYKRNKISNQLEQTQMIVMAAEYLSERAILDKLPWVTVDEIETILAEKAGEIDEREEKGGDLNTGLGELT